MKASERILLVAGCAAGFGLILATLGLGIGVISVLQPPAGHPATRTNVLLPAIGLLSGVIALVMVLRRKPLSTEAAIKRAETVGQLVSFQVWGLGLLSALFMPVIIWSSNNWWSAVDSNRAGTITSTVLFGGMGNVLGMGGVQFGLLGMALFSRWQWLHAEMKGVEDAAETA